MLWQGRVIGWANLPARDGGVEPAFGYGRRGAQGRSLPGALDEELQRMVQFSRRADAVGS